MQKVTGIGGVFIKCGDVKMLSAWYQKYLGIDFGNNTYADFKWLDKNNPGSEGHTVFSLFKQDSTYFNPSEKPFMINFRVNNLEELMTELKSEGVTVAGEIEVYTYGKFAWIIDPEGNKIELWQPVDEN